MGVPRLSVSAQNRGGVAIGLGSIRVPRVVFGVSPNTVFRRDAGNCTRGRAAVSRVPHQRGLAMRSPNTSRCQHYPCPVDESINSDRKAIGMRPVFCTEGKHEVGVQLFGNLPIDRPKENGRDDVCHI
jgi:hypothetical protein